MFIGENETRAMVLDAQAERAMDRLLGINNKGRQQIMTRHRPFRASWKARGRILTMPGLRDHDPIVLEEFNGWWKRGDPESAPSDHFVTANNVQYFNTGVESRVPLDRYQTEEASLKFPRRVYNYVMQTGQSLLVLTVGGNIYHIVNGARRGPGGNTLPILTIPEMEDFGFVAIAGRAYITPFKSTLNEQGVPYELGLQGQSLRVYKGDGVAARKAAGPPPALGGGVPFMAYNSQTSGEITKGIHLIGVGFNSGILGTEVFPVVEAPGDKEIQVENIPKLTGFVRTIAMTRAIDPKDYRPDNIYTPPLVWYTIEHITDDNKVSTKINFKDSSMLTVYTPTAGGAGGTDALTVANTNIAGFCDFGFHLVGVVFETDTGYLTSPGPQDATGKTKFAGQHYVDVTKSIKVTNIPIGPANVVKRHLVSTKWIPEYNGDQKGYQFFFIPKGILENNTATELVVNYYDSDLLSDASHLLDNFSEIPQGWVSILITHD